MDKVIIDGVDVSECSYAITPKRQCPNKPMPYAKETSCIGCKEHNTKLNFCKNNPDCYYKQLKRLQHYQAEFEHELMNDYTYDGYISPNGFTPIDVIKHIKSELQRLQAENERLKEENELIKERSKELYTFSATYENDKLKQALQEIRELIKKLDLSLGCAYGDYDCDNCSDINEETVCKIKLQNIILAKINEVIGAEE